MTESSRGRTARTLALTTAVLASVALSGCNSTAKARPLGEQVNTRFYSLVEGTEQGPGTVTVTGVRVGDVADLDAGGFELEPDQRRTMPHYVDITFTNTGNVPVDLRDPSGVDQDGELVTSLRVLELGRSSTFEPCPLLPDTLRPGRSVDGCAIVLVPYGVELQRISYLPDVGEDFVYWQSGL
jgi:hypothetical protein